MVKRKAAGALRRKAKKPRTTVALSRASILRQPKITFQRTSFYGSMGFGSAATTDFWKYNVLNIGSMNNYTEFTSVFDEYKIHALKYTFRPRYDGVDVNGQATPVSTNTLCYAHVINDPASTVIPAGAYNATTLNTFLEQGNVKSHVLTKPFSVYFKPMVARQLFGGGTASSMIKAPWIKTSETAVDHRGFHMFLQNNNMSTSNPGLILDIFVTYYVSFKGLK